MSERQFTQRDLFEEVPAKVRHPRVVAAMAANFAGCRKTTPTQRDEMVRRYLAGESPITIAADFGISKRTIRDYVLSRGHKCIRPRRRPKIYTTDETAFDSPLTTSARYWLGLLITDGCVVRRGKKGDTLQISLQERDWAHVEAFRAFLKTDVPVRECWGKTPRGKKKRHARIAIHSTPLCEAVIRHGVVPRKSPIAKAGEAVADCPHFWRGCIDGDGAIGYSSRTYPTVRLYGAFGLVTQFRAFATGHVGTARARVRPDRNIFVYSVNGDRALALLHLLYDDAGDALPRKRQRAADLVAARP